MSEGPRGTVWNAGVFRRNQRPITPARNTVATNGHRSGRRRRCREGRRPEPAPRSGSIGHYLGARESVGRAGGRDGMGIRTQGLPSISIESSSTRALTDALGASPTTPRSLERSTRPPAFIGRPGSVIEEFHPDPGVVKTACVDRRLIMCIKLSGVRRPSSSGFEAGARSLASDVTGPPRGDPAPEPVRRARSGIP